MSHFVNHAARLRRVLALDHLVQPAQAEASNGRAHIVGAADEADHPLDLYRSGAYSPAAFSTGRSCCLGAFGGLPVISSTVFERVSAT
jgi:hypothetical protein